jgi:hypothetical protein
MTSEEKECAGDGELMQTGSLSRGILAANEADISLQCSVRPKPAEHHWDAITERAVVCLAAS